MSEYDGPEPRAVLTVKKILAGRGGVDYYVGQTRRGLADYDLPDDRRDDGDGAARLSAPGSSWWGSGAETLALSGEVERPSSCRCTPKPCGRVAATSAGGSGCPRRRAQPRASCWPPASEITDPYERWMAKHGIRRRGGRLGRRRSGALVGGAVRRRPRPQ